MDGKAPLGLTIFSLIMQWFPVLDLRDAASYPARPYPDTPIGGGDPWKGVSLRLVEGGGSGWGCLIGQPSDSLWRRKNQPPVQRADAGNPAE